jgi:acyl carrier protein
MADKRAEIVDTIKQHLAQRGIEADNLQMDTDLVEDLGLDSLDTVELTLGLEESFGIEIPDSELENLKTVGDTVGLIERKLAVGA